MTAATAHRPHRLRARPGHWVRWAARGQGDTRCDGCGHSARTGWGFMDQGQVTTASAFICDECAKGLTTGLTT